MRRGATSEQVAGVRERRNEIPSHFDALFDEMDSLSLQGANLLKSGNWQELGALMNVCHGLLNAIGVSTPTLERMVTLARQAGAAGAKLTGAGGGGSIVALCPDGIDAVQEAMRQGGYQTWCQAGGISNERPHRIVSSESEELILVDADDNEIGSSSKADCSRWRRHPASRLFIVPVQR